MSRAFRSLLLLAAILPAAAPARAETIEVKIQIFQFTGQHLTIRVGDTVRWTNYDGSTHTTTEGTDLILNGNEAWHQTLTSNQSYSVTFSEAFLNANPRAGDEYAYFCVAHTGMRGSIKVVRSQPGTPFCFCAPLGPCSNRDYGAGCVNSSWWRGARMLAGGSASLQRDDLVLTIDLLPPNKTGVLLRSRKTIDQTQLGEGWRCIGEPLERLGTYSTGPFGILTVGPGIGTSTAGGGAPIVPGETWRFQLWYRDFTSQCGNDTNVSNAYAVRFVP